MTKGEIEKQVTDPDVDLINEVAKRHNQEKVYMIKIPLNDEGTEHAVGYIKKPNRQILGAAMSEMSRNPLKANEIILRSCWLEGDKSILDDDDVFLAAGALIQNIIQIRTGEVKKN
jgi:hypothetical protein